MHAKLLLVLEVSEAWCGSNINHFQQSRDLKVHILVVMERAIYSKMQKMTAGLICILFNKCELNFAHLLPHLRLRRISQGRDYPCYADEGKVKCLVWGHTARLWIWIQADSDAHTQPTILKM